MSKSVVNAVVLGAKALTVSTLRSLSAGTSKLTIDTEAWKKVAAGRAVVDNIVASGKVAYGINTGFGLFANVVVEPNQLVELQENLIRSHAIGTGAPLTVEQTRMLLALRMNTLARGHSGIRTETLERMVAAFNADCLSVIPGKGTVGASGDLAPLSHLALGLMGEGMMWDTATNTHRPSLEVLKSKGVEPIRLEAKEGLALINGTQMMTALGAEAIHRSQNVALTADISAALSVEVLKGTRRAFHSSIHSVRPHVGQSQVAKRLRTLLTPSSDLFKSHMYHGKVQDAYSLRCVPQVHGIVHDTIQFVADTITTEMNSALDNPMIFTGSDEDENEWERLEETMELDDSVYTRSNTITKFKQDSDIFYRGEGGFVISGGNFHGEYPAKVLDYLAIGVSELGNISERRIERLVNPYLSELPAFLVDAGGLNSGFMIAHCTAAALASENKVLCHPASVDTISTSGAKEDHVSMGGFAAHKSIQVVDNVETIIAIEILAACQGMEFFRPHKTTEPLERLYDLVRTHVKPLKKDRYMAEDLEAVKELIKTQAIVKTVMPEWASAL
eukprot:m.16109 g.16109  ORF g.16109 m.16109 type:complete len:560 (+) comp10882_c0_seq2:276-1955(+)